MSARMIQLGLISLIGSAIAVPVFPTGPFQNAGNNSEGEPAGPTGTGRRHYSAKPWSTRTGSSTLEAISTPEAVSPANAAAVDDTTSCSETFYTTTTDFLTVYMTPSAAASASPTEADSTIFASSVAPSSAPAAVIPVASALASAPAAVVPVASASAPAAVVPVASSSDPAAVVPVASSTVATSSPPVVETPVTSASSIAQNVGKVSYSNTAVVVASSAPSATVSTASTSSVGGKRGIAYNSPSLAKLLIGKSQWAYNWGSVNGGLASGVEFLPMLWGAGTEKTGTWVKDATAGIAAGATSLLGFNEPDHPEQANLSPAAAATAYKTHITSNFAGKAKLISPAVTNGGGSMGLTWLSSFMSACTDCKIDAVAIHWYDSSSNVDYFKSHIQDAHTRFGLPVYLTEFGTTDGNDQAFLAAVLPWLDSQDYVSRYAYFMASDGKLISGTTLSAAGNTYCA